MIDLWKCLTIAAYVLAIIALFWAEAAKETSKQQEAAFMQHLQEHAIREVGESKDE